MPHPSYKSRLDEDFLHLWGKGLTDREISEKIGCHHQTVTNYRGKLKMKPNYYKSRSLDSKVKTNE